MRNTGMSQGEIKARARDWKKLCDDPSLIEIIKINSSDYIFKFAGGAVFKVTVFNKEFFLPAAKSLTDKLDFNFGL